MESSTPFPFRTMVARRAWRRQAARLDVGAINALIVARRDARARRDWAEADRIRDELAQQGVVLEDGAAGTVWRRD